MILFFKFQSDMILSMTGYGKASAMFGNKKITAEIKSLNSKALDLQSRVTALYREKEMEIRGMIQSVLERGKVDFAIWIETDDVSTGTTVNSDVVKAYATQLRQAAETAGVPVPENMLEIIMRMPDVYMKNDVMVPLADEEWAVARNVVAQAIDALMDFRRQEGVALQKKFEQNLDSIASLLADIEPYEKKRVEAIRNRIEDGLASLKNVEIDHGRLEQEMIYYIEKLDINEEKQRLRNHLQYFRDTMNEGKGQGKKLGFIAQEMGREINTTGSKSNQAEMQNIVVMMKDELEQIKEQVLNVM